MHWNSDALEKDYGRGDPVVRGRASPPPAAGRATTPGELRLLTLQKTAPDAPVPRSLSGLMPADV